ncbi:MutH/Sau3AI family endonuclease [Oceanobacillus timonensis]|uniref:MutH/Sau3AI family endonuclease n=1 Tax=Oceanobacillus timonensis TaxID=1926285 RepID=UPI0009BAC0EB|nr:MutH/Sau3AI family endonuclease [Oceanobacillus timonensis]
MEPHKFTRKELDKIFNNVVGKTLGEADTKNVFARTITHPKITGIAGDVIEQSVLGYPANQAKNPDLTVDDIDIELKTTGLRKPKKKKDLFFEAKEPMTITAVSPHSITNEEFETSNFWHKLEHLLLVYYHYDSSKTVSAAEYADFIIEGFHFHEFSSEDKEILKKDWLIVRDFIQYLKDTYENPEDEYARISSDLKKTLMLIDTAPKWPHRPRFRLKRTTVSTIAQKHFGAKFEKLDETYTSLGELDNKLHLLSNQYKNKTVQELMDILGITKKLNKKGDVNKGISEQIIVKMFGGKAKKLNKIDLFSKIGIIPKTIVQTTKGSRTEDMKLFPIDFEEWTNPNTPFEDSFVYNYFNQQFLCIIFEEPSPEAKLLDNKFIGFKRMAIDESIVENEIRSIWEEIRDLINSNKLEEVPVLDKNQKQRFTPKTKKPMSALNFPKAKHNNFFLRGSGEDASKKTFSLNGIQMYKQNVWMRGKFIISMLEDVDFI